MKAERTFQIGPFNLNFHDFITVLGQFPALKNIEFASKIDGPFDGKINSIYMINWDKTIKQNSEAVIFRTRISKAFRYEPIVKEKILYPFLDGSLSINTPHLKEEINQITHKNQGSYIFTSTKPSIVPAQNLLYFYEPNKNIDIPINPNKSLILPPNVFPYLLTIKNYLSGCSFYDILKNLNPDQKNSESIKSVFIQAGKLLAKLHTIHFDAFYEQIMDIGGDIKPSWRELFSNQWTKNFRDASQYKSFQPLMEPIKRYLKAHEALVADEKEAVIFHNDYQSQNLIIEESTQRRFDSPRKFKITGIIDFDNWRIGPPAQDFIKMEYWTIQNEKLWLDCFYEGYNSVSKISNELRAGISLYKLLWFMLVFAFEMDKVAKNERNLQVDARFPAAEKYLIQIKELVKDYL